MTVNEINIARVNRAYDKAMELIFRRPKKDGTKYPLYYRFSISKILRTRKSKIWHQFYIEADTFMKWLFPHIPQPSKSQKSTGPYARQINQKKRKSVHIKKNGRFVTHFCLTPIASEGITKGKTSKSKYHLFPRIGCLNICKF